MVQFIYFFLLYFLVIYNIYSSNFNSISNFIINFICFGIVDSLEILIIKILKFTKKKEKHYYQT